jgi:hypothetical protein
MNATTDPARLRSHEEFTRALRRAGYPDAYIRRLLSQLPDPIHRQRDQQILGRYA